MTGGATKSSSTGEWAVDQRVHVVAAGVTICVAVSLSVLPVTEYSSSHSPTSGHAKYGLVPSVLQQRHLLCKPASTANLSHAAESRHTLPCCAAPACSPCSCSEEWLGGVNRGDTEMLQRRWTPSKPQRPALTLVKKPPPQTGTAQDRL